MNNLTLLMIEVMLFTSVPCRAITIHEWTSGNYEISGSDDYDWIKLYNSVTVNMTAGTVGTISAYDSSIFTMSGGTFIDYGVNLYNTSHANIFDSDSAIAMFLSDSSTTDIFGGLIGYLRASDNSVINIYGSAFQYNPSGSTGGGELTGFWGNGSSFSIDFDSEDSYSHVTLHIIPEPTTLSLLALGAFLAGRRRK